MFGHDGQPLNKLAEPKMGWGGEMNKYICEDAVCEIVFLGAHALLDDRVPHFDILGVPWCLLERGDGKVHIALLA